MSRKIIIRDSDGVFCGWWRAGSRAMWKESQHTLVTGLVGCCRHRCPPHSIYGPYTYTYISSNATHFANKLNAPLFTALIYRSWTNPVTFLEESESNLFAMNAYLSMSDDFGHHLPQINADHLAVIGGCRNKSLLNNKFNCFRISIEFQRVIFIVYWLKCVRQWDLSDTRRKTDLWGSLIRIMAFESKSIIFDANFILCGDHPKGLRGRPLFDTRLCKSRAVRMKMKRHHQPSNELPVTFTGSVRPVAEIEEVYLAKPQEGPKKVQHKATIPGSRRRRKVGRGEDAR